MPIPSISDTDGFRELRDKINQLIVTVNSLGGSASVVNVISPSTAQTLIYDGTFFRNVTFSGDISVASNGVVTVNSNANNGITKGRQLFLSSIRQLY